MYLRLPGDVTVTTSDPMRPAVFTVAAWSIVVAMFGRRARFSRIARLVRPQVLALTIAGATLSIGVGYATTAASGADAWPMARWTFNPLGYRPSNVAGEEWILVPQYSPGLPLLLAAAKILGGQEAMFWVVPLSGAVLVLATFGIGRRLGSPYAGVVGAWLAATSPAFLFMLMAPMTDVPVAAAWAASIYFLLDRRYRSAAAAGLAAGLAIVIRPNLVGCAVALGLWHLVPLLRPGTVGRRTLLGQGALFWAGAGTGALFIAVFNQALNGSPFISTYGGSLAGMFSSDHFWPNLIRYTGWLVETQTPFILAGVAALLLPWRRLWPATDERLAFLVMGLFVASVWLVYLFYAVFDDWWYLRFVLASWPLLMVGSGAVVAAVARSGGRPGVAAATVAVIALGIYQIVGAADRNVFNLWKEERRYVTVARHVRSMTDRTSAIFSMQHSGSIRYYGGRVSVRYDAMDRRWVDRAVEWLAERGVRSYLLLDDWEIPVAAEAMAGQRAAERLKDPPLLHYRGTSQVYLFALSEPRDPLVPTVSVVDTYEDTRSATPVTLVPLDLTSLPTPPASPPDPDR
jgi:hypothetical protein